MNTTNDKRKFSQTRQLVAIALNAGMNQIEIARICRVQQSIVSNWLHGKSNASYVQIKPLLKEYGNLLSQKTARLYYKTETGQNKPSYFRVEGSIIFSHIIYNLNDETQKREKAFRYIVHDQNNRFVLITQEYQQTLIEFSTTEGEIIAKDKESTVPEDDRIYDYKGFKTGWRKVITKKKTYYKNDNFFFSLDNEKANWNTLSIKGNLLLKDLLKEIDLLSNHLQWISRGLRGSCENGTVKYYGMGSTFDDGKKVKENINRQYMQDGIVLPFLIRDALYQHGYTTDDVETYQISDYN